MEWGTVAGMITAMFTMITAIGGAVVSIKVMIPNFRVNKDTHKIVNQQRTDMTNWNRALVRALNEAGVAVPIDQSAEDTTHG